MVNSGGVQKKCHLKIIDSPYKYTVVYITTKGTNNIMKNRICPICRKHPIKGASYDYCNTCHRHKSVETHRRFKRACLEYKDAKHPLRCTRCKREYRQDCLCLRHMLERSDNTPISKFSGSANLKDDCKEELDKCQVLCKNCEAEVYRSRRGATPLKKKALAHKGGACTSCGYSAASAALEFHHVDGRGAPTKRLTLGQRGLNRFAEIVDELNKVEILCSNCHSEAHAAEKERERMEEKERLLRPAVAKETAALAEEVAGELDGSPNEPSALDFDITDYEVERHGAK